MLPFRGESRGVKRKNDYYYIINHKVIFDYLFKSSYMPV